MKLGDKDKVWAMVMSMAEEMRVSSFMKYAGDNSRRKEVLARANEAYEAYEGNLPEDSKGAFREMAELQEDLKECDLTLSYVVGMLDCIDLMQGLGFLEVYRNGDMGKDGGSER